MGKWLVQKCAVPNWLTLLIMILSVVSFVVSVAKTGELYVQKDIAESQLAETKCILETLDVQENDMLLFFSCGTCGMDAPPAAAFRFTEIQVGFACVLGVIAGAGWTIFQNKTMV